jgi:precorrin-6Y C5,15-methyltransferase (decarboxylating)
MFKVFLIGVDGSSLSQEAAKALKQCGTVVGTERLSNCFDLSGKKVFPVTPLVESLTRVKQNLADHDVAVLASGDPLFFGIGRRLLDRLGEEQLEFFPARSSMQLAAARFKIPWDDAAFVSLHGREVQDYAKLLQYRKVFVLTDKRNSPDVISGHLIEALDKAVYGDQLQWKVWVGERLGMPDERIVQGNLEEIASSRFDPLNIMLLVCTGDRSSFPRNPFGLHENEIAHSRGLITKNEVRAATLHALRLPKTGVFWDIGAGSGSISLEATAICPQLKVFAVERDQEQLAHIKTNSSRYLAGNIKVVVGKAPTELFSLPDPDRVFIGGSGGQLKEIINECSERLVPGGRIVVNGVIAATKELAPRLMHEAGLAVTISEIAVSRYRPYEEATETTFNPISIMVGQK